MRILQDTEEKFVGVFKREILGESFGRFQHFDLFSVNVVVRIVVSTDIRNFCLVCIQF